MPSCCFYFPPGNCVSSETTAPIHPSIQFSPSVFLLSAHCSEFFPSPNKLHAIPVLPDSPLRVAVTSSCPPSSLYAPIVYTISPPLTIREQPTWSLPGVLNALDVRILDCCLDLITAELADERRNIHRVSPIITIINTTSNYIRYYISTNPTGSPKTRGSLLTHSSYIGNATGPSSACDHENGLFPSLTAANGHSSSRQPFQQRCCSCRPSATANSHGRALRSRCRFVATPPPHSCPARPIRSREETSWKYHLWLYWRAVGASSDM